MTRPLRSLAPFIAALLAASVALVATPAQAERPPGPRVGAPMPPPPERREEMRKRVEQKIRTYLTVELSSRLALDDKRALQLGEAVQKHMQRKHERKERLKEEGRKLRDLVEQKAADAKVKAQLDIVTGLAGKDDDLHAFLADTGKFLSVTEQAKLALSLPEILRDVHRIVKDARRQMRGPGPMVPDDDEE